MKVCVRTQVVEAAEYQGKLCGDSCGLIVMLACARQVHPRALPGEPPMAAQYLCAKMYGEFAVLPEVDEMGSFARYICLLACKLPAFKFAFSSQ